MDGTFGGLWHATDLPHPGTMVSRLNAPELIFKRHHRGLSPFWCLRSAEQAHRGRQRLRKWAMHEDRANPISINALNAGSFQTAMASKGTCNYLSGFKGLQLTQGAVSGAKKCRGMEDLFCLLEAPCRVARDT